MVLNYLMIGFLYSRMEKVTMPFVVLEGVLRNGIESIWRINSMN